MALRFTPLDVDHIKRKILASPKRIHHVSDALRLAILYKIGGWYFDIDTVILKPLDTFKHRDLVSSDQKNANLKNLVDPETGLPVAGAKVANGVIHVSKNESKLLLDTMANFREMFDNRLWSSGGADSLSRALRQLCAIPKNSFLDTYFTGKAVFSKISTTVH